MSNHLYFSTYKLPESNYSTNKTMGDDDPCWSTSEITRMNAYRIFVVSLSDLDYFNLSYLFKLDFHSYIQLTTLEKCSICTIY